MADVKPRYTIGEIKEEEIVRIPDGKGNINEVINVEGMVVPIPMIKNGHTPDIRDNLKKIRTMKCRDDDVFLCAYIRSGTHWVWEISNMLATGKLDYLTQPKETAMMEFHYPEEFDNIPSRRILNTHLPLRLLPPEVKDRKLKVLLVQRNPKDVMVSAFHFLQKAKTMPFEGTFEDFFTRFSKLGLRVSWFDYTLEAEKAMKDKEFDMHVIHYEQLKKNPESTIKRLSEFLGTDRNDEFIKQVAEKCSFKGMKKANEEVKDKDKFKFEEEIMKGHYRKGEVGDWKNIMTVAQSEQFDEIFANKMKDSSFRFDFSK